LGYFDSNLSLITTRQPELANLLRQTVVRRAKVFPSVSGLPTASWENGTTSIALHSRYDPLREARQKLKAQQYQDADYFIFLGFGLGYLLDALLEEVHDPSIHCFIVESDLELLRAAFEARDLSPALSLPNVHFAWPVSSTDLAEQWGVFFDPVLAHKSTFLLNVTSISLNPGLFKSAAEIIQSQTFQTFTDINTLVAKSQEFLDNFALNLPKTATSPGVIKFGGAFADHPAIIVSAGPSLDKNIHELRGHEDNVLILATDTALKPLLAAGIDPHFVLTGDPSHANYLHLRKASSRQALLVAEATSYPDSFTEFEGRTITCIFDKSALRSLADLLGNKGTLRAWGSVATMAVDFALLLQCNPIIFVGQDLAHTDGRIYCTGTYFDEDWFSCIKDPEAWRSQLERLRSGRRTVTVEDIYGNPIESTDKLVSYWNWILKEIHNHPKVRFVNATEGGILREGVEIVSLRDALHRYCGQRRDLRSRIWDLFRKAQDNSLLYAGVDLSVLAGEVNAFQDILKRGLEFCRPESGYSAQDLMKRLESVKGSIYFNPHLAPLIDSFNQMGNVDFLRKRHVLLQKPLSDDNLPVIRSLYLEYFKSVGEAFAKIKQGLSKIESELNDCSSRPSRVARPRPAKTPILPSVG
jgi:hypothetical protein